MFGIRREIEKLFQEMEMLKKYRQKPPPEIRIRRYHALLKRIGKSPEVGITPDEAIALLRRKDY